MTIKVLPLAATIVAVGACGGSNSVTPPTPVPTQAAITLTVAPNPATGAVCSPACVATNGISYQFHATSALTIQETSGIAGNIDSIVSGSISYTSADVVQRSGTSRVSAAGSLIFPLNFDYGATTNPNASRSTVFPITVAFTDDRGNHLSAIVQWAVN
jgi:hypothetical protein